MIEPPKQNFQLFKEMCYFPPLVLKGIYHDWKCVYFFQWAEASGGEGLGLDYLASSPNLQPETQRSLAQPRVSHSCAHLDCCSAEERRGLWTERAWDLWALNLARYVSMPGFLNGPWRPWDFSASLEAACRHVWVRGPRFELEFQSFCLHSNNHGI